MINREAIYAALFARLAGIPGLVTASRTLRHWNDTAPEQQPALFVAQGSQSPSTQPGLPTRWTLAADVYVYARASGGSASSTVLNALLDAIEAALPWNPITGQHDNLGRDDVAWARIDGPIETDEGTLGEQAVAIIPIRVLAA